MVRQARTLRMAQRKTEAAAVQEEPVVVRRREPQANSPAVQTPALPVARSGQAGLRQDTRSAAEAFIAQVRGTTRPRDSDRAAGRQLEQTVRTHSAFVQTVATLCANKMQNENMSAKSVCQAVGVMSAMWLLSPSMRKVSKAQRQELKVELSRRLDERALIELDRAGGDATTLSRKWQKRIESLEGAKPTDREMFTASSAALTVIGLSENAAAQLRTIGPVVDEQTQAAADAVRAEQQELTDKVYGLAFADRIDPAEIDELVQINLMQHVAHEPARAADFEGLTYGEHVSNSSGDPSRFYDRAGLPVRSKTLLTPRSPLSPAQHREQLAATVDADLEQAYQSNDASKLLDRLRDHVHGDDRPALNHALRADGFDTGVLRADVCQKSVMVLGALHPRLRTAMTEVYGDSWSQDIVRDLREGSDMGPAARSLSEMMMERQAANVKAAEPTHAEPVQGDTAPSVDASEYEPSF